MKKVIITGIMFLIILAVFGACESKKGITSSSSLNGSQAALDVQYIRVGYSSDFPTYTIINSRETLNLFHISRNIDNISLRDPEFINAISKYTDSYFADNFLVIVCLIENSGSIRHKVERIEANGDIVINRITPEIGTADMAAWNIIIELNNKHKMEQYRAVLVETRN